MLNARGRKTINMTSRKCGRLTIINQVKSKKGSHARWNCLCDCGNKRVVSGAHLRNGKIKSCGCYASEKSSETCKKISKEKAYTLDEVLRLVRQIHKRICD